MAGEDAAEVLAEVIDSYLEDAPKLLQAISAAVAQGDTTALYQAAHTLKPTSATLGAITLPDLQGSRSSGRTGTMADVLAIVLQVEAEYERVQAAFAIERQACRA